EEAEPLFAVKSTTSVKKVIKLMADGIPRILVSLGYVKSGRHTVGRPKVVGVNGGGSVCQVFRRWCPA
ncbi:hypothetical protein SARC_16572, partial [Sphaeroforma arctica JP610]